jgi:hypothetical protein
VDCVTSASCVFPRPIPDTEAILALGGRSNPAILDSDPPIGLWISFSYKIVRVNDYRGPWKIKTLAYQYTLLDQHEKEIISYQWHPALYSFPHIHIPGRYKGIHFETGRIYLEQVLRTAIIEFGVRPLKTDWSNILAQRQQNVQQHGSWR